MMSTPSSQYATDVPDGQWQRIEPLLPAPRWQPNGPGRPPRDRRRIVNGLLYRTKTGGPWALLPAWFGPWKSVYDSLLQYLSGISQICNAIDSGDLSNARISAIKPDLFRIICEGLSHSETVEEFRANYRKVVRILSHIFGANFPAVVHEKEDLEFWTKDDKWKELRWDITKSQKIGLFHKLGLREKYPKSRDAYPIIGLGGGGGTLRLFDSAKKKFARNGQPVSTAIGYLCDRPWNISDFRDASEALEKAETLQDNLNRVVDIDITLNENIRLSDAVDWENYLPLSDLEVKVKDLDEAAIDKLRRIGNFPKRLLPKRELGEPITKYFSRGQCSRANVPLTARIVFRRWG